MKNECKLPVELLRPIFQKIESSATLVSVCLASRLFRSEAEGVLYLCPMQFSLRRPNLPTRLLTCLLNHPRLPPLIRIYRVPAVAGPKKEPIWNMLSSVLPMMVNLKDLSIIGFDYDFRRLPMDKVVCQLVSLSWTQIDSEVSTILPRWLPSQKALRKLRWIYRRPVELSPSACPNLESLEGCFHVISALLPGRHIRRLDWITDPTLQMCPEVNKTVRMLSAHFYNLELISFDTQLNAIHYHSLAEYLPPTIKVELHGTNLESIDKTIAILPNLRVLILSTHKGYQQTLIFPDDQRSTIVQGLFAKSSNLFRVDITAKWEWNNAFYALYERWERGVKREGLLAPEDMWRV